MGAGREAAHQRLQLHVDLGGPPVDFLDLGVDPRDEVALARARRTNHLIGRRNGVREVQDVFIELTDAACGIIARQGSVLWRGAWIGLRRVSQRRGMAHLC